LPKASTSPSTVGVAVASCSTPPAPVSATRRGPEPLPLTKLRHPFDPHRAQIDAGRVVALANDIAVNGLLQPIGVRGPMPDGTYEVCYGDRRTYAHEHLKKPTIDGYIYPADTEPLDIRASENLFHEALDPVEQARIARRFLDQGLSLPVVCARMGHSPDWVAGRLAILDYPEDLRTAVADGSLSLAVAAQLAAISHAGIRGEYLAEALRTGATTRTVGVWLAHWRADGERMAANHEAIDVIIREREQYEIHVTCEGCQTTVSITRTRTLRFCEGCIEEIGKAAAAP